MGVQMALAKSFIFHVVRSRRICEHEASTLVIGREDRKKFLTGTNCVVAVRDVNEHGFESGAGARGKRSHPSMHHHEADSAILDETSLIILDDRKILVGPLNLFEVYGVVKRMQQLAGFASLAR
jgi:hypothetical protein